MNKPPTVRRPDAHKAWDYLSGQSQTHGVDPICRPILEDPVFCEAPASAGIHHCRESGLLVHTAEVLGLTLASACAVQSGMHHSVGFPAAVIASIYHDCMKVRDYFWKIKADGSISVGHKPYHKMIHHIAGSYAKFMVVMSRISPEQLGLGPKQKKALEDEVGHAILSHHGRLEWHSPVTPLSSLAILLHQADYASAHIDALTNKSEKLSS